MTEPSKTEPWPSELRVRDNGLLLKVTFEDGVVGEISAERLRDASPSADKSRPPLPPGREMAIVAIEQVGNYAARVEFSDGHSTGIYTWRLLRSLTTQ